MTVVMDQSFTLESVWAIQAKIAEKREGFLTRIEELKLEITALSDQIAEANTAMRVLTNLTGGPPPVPADYQTEGLGDLGCVESKIDDAVDPTRHRRGELRRLILESLNTIGRDGKSVTELHSYILARHNVDIQVNTLSVTLNRLKAAGAAKLVGQIWSPASLDSLNDPSSEASDDDRDHYD